MGDERRQRVRQGADLGDDGSGGRRSDEDGRWLDGAVRGGRPAGPDGYLRRPRLLLFLYGGLKVSEMFSRWPDVTVRLDIWHFMRRFAAAVTTESHALYATFMAKLSACVFEWQADDIAALRAAKVAALRQQGAVGTLDVELTRTELARHCRRRTRGVEATTRLLQQLVAAFDSDDACDTLGVRLFEGDRLRAMWAEQRRHVACIQDPEDVDGLRHARRGRAARFPLRAWFDLAGVFPPPPEPLRSR